MNKAFVVGIAGGSASGKTSFSIVLEKKLQSFQVKVIHMDDYFRQEQERPYEPSPVNGKYYVDDNHPLTMDMEKIANELEVAKDNGLFQVILIEGILPLWDKKIYEMLDLKLFVDCLPDERIVRRLKRNMGFGLDFDEIADVYLNLVRFRHEQYVEPSKWKADFILNGTVPSETALSILTDYIKGKIL